MLVCAKNVPAKIELSQSPPTPFQALRTAHWNFLELMPEACLHQRVVSGWMGLRYHLLMDPPLIRDLLNARVDDFPKSDIVGRMFRTVAPHNIVSAEGETWEKMRPPMALATNGAALRPFSEVLTSSAEAAAQRIEQELGKTINIESHMTRSALDVVSKLSLSDEASPALVETVHRALSGFAVEISRFSPLDLINTPDWLPRPDRGGRSPAIAYGHYLVDDAIAMRKLNGPKPKPDILDKLLAAQKKDSYITDAHIRDNLNVILIAGHDTNAHTLAWAIYLCAFAPEIQEAASVEARKVLQGLAAGLEDTKHLPLIARIIKETMRLYPAFPLLVRKSLISEALHGVDFRRGDQVVIPLYALHRNRLFWEDADSFIPSRFDGTAKITKNAFLPFGSGPRTCIGASSAQSQMQILLATLLSRYRFSLVDGRVPQPKMTFSLLSRNGIHVKADRIDRR